MNQYGLPYGQGDYYQRKIKNKKEETRNLIQPILKTFQNMSNYSHSCLTRRNLKNYQKNKNETTTMTLMMSSGPTSLENPLDIRFNENIKSNKEDYVMNIE